MHAGLAERLVGGLSSENERWGREIDHQRDASTTLIGDCMLAAVFVSYVGSFDQANQVFLWKSTWTPDLRIPLTPNMDHLSILTTDGNNAKMISLSFIENGSILHRERLLIDPQTPGNNWLRQKEEGNGLEVFQLNQKYVDATIDPVLPHAIYKKYMRDYLRFGGEEVEYDNKFQ